MKPVANSDMRDFWNNAGGRMWVDFQDMIETSMTPFGHNAMNMASIDKGDRVLDIGCGCGETSLEISQLVGPKGRVLGVDISEMIVASAKQNIDFTKHPNLSFECIDAQTHDFTANAFDVVFSRFGVMFFDDPVVAFDNICRSLIPGGRMSFVCWQPMKAVEWVSLPLEIVSKYVALPPPSSPEGPGGFSFGDANRVGNILYSAGFVDIVTEPLDTKIYIGADLSEAITFLTHVGPAGSVLENPDIDTAIRTRFTTELRAALTPYRTNHGVELGAAIWIVKARKPD